MQPAVRLAKPELMYRSKIERHSDRSRTTCGEVEEPCVWKLKTKGGSTLLAMTALRKDNRIRKASPAADGQNANRLRFRRELREVEYSQLLFEPADLRNHLFEAVCSE